MKNNNDNWKLIMLLSIQNAPEYISFNPVQLVKMWPDDFFKSNEKLKCALIAYIPYKDIIEKCLYEILSMAYSDLPVEVISTISEMLIRKYNIDSYTLNLYNKDSNDSIHNDNYELIWNCVLEYVEVIFNAVSVTINQYEEELGYLIIGFYEPADILDNGRIAIIRKKIETKVMNLYDFDVIINTRYYENSDGL